ncbi:tail assembly chaperone [Arthrobacter phage Waltz]|nr:tail assembly chaperone [Arthrobacter phage Waltz]
MTIPAFDADAPATPFVEGTHPGAYSPSGEFHGNEAPVAAPAAPVPAQVAVVASELGGYRAPGGGARLSIRDRAVAARPYQAENVEVPEWDATVEVRSLPLGERNEMMAEVMDEDGNADFQAMFPALLIRSAFDPETGERVFAHDDTATINGLDSKVVDRVAEVALKLSGLTDKAKDLEAGKSSKTVTSV